MLMLQIAGGILLALAIIIFADVIARITWIAILIAAGIIFAAWISSSLPPHEVVEPFVGLLILLLLLGGLANTFYRCYKEFIRGWRES